MKILVARRANHNISKLVVIISRPEKLRISYISFFLITHPVNLFLYKFASSENRDVSIRRRASHFYNDANFSLFTWEGREGEVQQKRNGSILFFRPKLRRSTILRRSFRAFRTSGEAALQRKLEKKTLRYTSFQSSKLRIVNVQRSHPRPQHYDSITLPTRTVSLQLCERSRLFTPYRSLDKSESSVELFLRKDSLHSLLQKFSTRVKSSACRIFLLSL